MANPSAKKKPKLSRLEVERHAALAGAEAVAKASASGADPRLVPQLARGATKRVIGGLAIGPASMASLVALEKLWASELWAKSGNIAQLALMAYAYLNPSEALAAKDDSEIEAQANAFAAQVPIADIRNIATEIRQHIADANGLGE